MRNSLFLLCLFISQFAFAQYERVLDFMKVYLSVPLEQTYMEYDHKSGCYPGDTIRFSVSVLRLDSLVTSKLSDIVYVELRAPSGVTVDRKCLRLNEGKAESFVVVDELLKSGLYEICAYTRLQTNGREPRYYSRVLPVYAPADRLSKSEAIQGKVAYIDDRNFRQSDVTLGALRDKSPKTQIRYEGGHIADGFTSRVAVHVNSNTTGKPDAEIRIHNTNDGSVHCMKTDWLGNASLLLNPKVINYGFVLNYVYDMTVSGKSFRHRDKRTFGVIKRNVGLRAEQNDTSVNISIVYPETLNGKKVCRLIINRGRVLYADTCCLADGGRETIQLHKDSLQRGINTFALIRERGKYGYDILASRNIFIGDIKNGLESWMLLESQLPQTYIGDFAEGMLPDDVLDNLMLTTTATIPGLWESFSAKNLYFSQINEEHGKVVSGYVRPRTASGTLYGTKGMKLNVEFVQGNTRKKHEVTTNSRGQFFIRDLDLKGDWTLIAKPENRDYRYEIVLNEGFAAKVRPYLLRELDPGLYGMSKWKMCKYEKKLIADFYNCDAFERNSNVAGVPFYYWLSDMDMKFSDLSEEQVHQLQYPECENASMMVTGGPAYSGRPVVWIIDGKYRMTTGLKKQPKDINVTEVTSTPVPMFLDQAKSVIVTDAPKAYRKCVSSPTLDALKPVTVSIRLHGNYEWETDASVCAPFHGTDN